MWSVLSRLLLRIAALRWLFKLGGLGLLIPIALLLKTVGLPLLLILAVLAIPVLVLLFIFGLPIFLVLIVGSMIMGLLSIVLTIGIAAVKIGLFVVLPIWLIWKVVGAISRSCRKRGGDDTTPPTTSSSTDSSTDSTTESTDGSEL
jgi:hypothetical protein